MNGKMHGYGEFYWPHIKYSGTYENNMKHGRGTYSYSDGSSLTCHYERDLLVNSIQRERFMLSRKPRRRIVLFV